MHKINSCEGGLKLAEIATKDVGENDLNTITKYFMVRLDKWDKTLVQEGWQETGESLEQGLIYDLNELSWELSSIIMKC